MSTEWIEVWTRKGRVKVMLAHVAPSQNAQPIISDWLARHDDRARHIFDTVIGSQDYLIRLTPRAY